MFVNLIFHIYRNLVFEGSIKKIESRILVSQEFHLQVKWKQNIYLNSLQKVPLLYCIHIPAGVYIIYRKHSVSPKFSVSFIYS